MAPVTQAGKGHVPEENLHEYRKLAQIARQYKTLGNNLSNAGYTDHAAEALYLSRIFWDDANNLRVDLPNK